MTKKLSWRLSKLPTVEELQQLVKDKIITKEEARDVLFNDKEEQDVKALQERVKFLQQLVERLADKPTQIVEVVRDIGVPYYRHDWYAPYSSWCSTMELSDGSFNPIETTLTDTTSGTKSINVSNPPTAFSNI